jgi:hypothetical protein
MANKDNKETKVKCKYCGEEFSPKGIANHEAACDKNPKNSKEGPKVVKVGKKMQVKFN